MQCEKQIESFFKSIFAVHVSLYVLRKLFFLLCIEFVFYATIHAQVPNIKFKHLSNNDGLSQNSVNAILQDYMGFLWFGTYDGLNKYDGNEFIVYKNIPGQQNSLINNSINVLFEDSNKNIWIGTHYGACRYDRVHDIFIPIERLRTTYVNGIYELDNGIICFSTYVDFMLYNPEDESIVSIYNKGVPLNYDLFTGGILKYADNKYCITTKKGLYSLNGITNDITPIYIHNYSNSHEINIETIYRDKYDNIWVGTFEKGLFLLNLHGDDSTEFVLTNYLNDSFRENGFTAKNIEVFAEDENDNLWIGTESGVFILNLKALQDGKVVFYNLKHEPGNDFSLPNSSIKSIHKDKVGTMWVGSHASGVSYYNKLLFKFHVLQYMNDITGINQKQVSYIYGEKKFFWIGTENGLNKYDMTTGKWEYFVHDPNDETSIGSNIITLVYRDSRGNLWVGTWAGGLNLLDEKSGTFTRFIHEEDNMHSITCNNVFGLVEDDKGRLWVGTMGGGVNRYDYISNRFIKYMSNSGTNSFSSNWIKNIMKDRKGNLWFATGYGLNVYDVETNLIRHYFNDPTNPKSLCYNSMVFVFEDSKGTIWAGTENGLSRLNSATGDFSVYSEANGLPNNVIRAICDDDNGDLWISSNKGLTRFVNAVGAIDSAYFVNYGTDDGLQGNEFNSRSCYKDENGVLYFGGTNGMNSFLPDSIPENNIPPKLILTDLLIFNKPIKIGTEDSPLDQHINLTKHIELDYNQSVITIKYASLNFIAPEKNRYKYIMKGFDSDWNDVGNKMEATYTNLNPGKYEFIVIGANNDGVWNNEGIHLAITILPPWWKTILFKIVISLIIVGFAVSFYYVRIFQLESQKKLLKAEVDKRTAEIKQKNRKLEQKTLDLNRANFQLEERQLRVIEQAQKLHEQTDELKKKNKDLSVLNSTKDKFFSIIAHDLKNPFSTVLSFSKLLKDRYELYDDEKRKHLLDIVNDSANSYYKLLENLLEWSRAQTGNIQYNPEKIYVFEIFNEIKQLLKNLLEEKELDIFIFIPKDFCVFADKNMITTVFRNLITNAIKFSEKGSITVSALNESLYSKITVQDQGIGMSEEIAESIFKIEKSKNTIGTRGEKGTGLGLIICKEFIDYHGGKINVYSEKGEGTSFVIELPIKKSCLKTQTEKV